MSATPQGTKAYFDKLKSRGIEVRHAALGATELQVSRVGFGGYRVHEFEPAHREALREALVNGCNLIDTSSNYTDGGSEKLIGNVLHELFEANQLKREEIVVVTKAGYVQGKNLQEAKARQRAFPEMVEFQTDCWHNISPEYLEDQLTRSLERLRLSSVDFFLLHNPEYYMKTSGSRETYYSRIERAFRHLESERSKGRIKWYGVSSNTFPEAESRSDFTSLTRVIDIAKNIAKELNVTPGFAVIQLPFNLYESGAAMVPNNKQETVLELASKHRLGVITNRPFNSFHRGRLVRLTSFPRHDEVEIKGGLHQMLGRAVELERQAPGYPRSHQGFQWAQLLREKLGDLDDLLGWRDVLFNQVYPSIRQALAKLPSDKQAWGEEFQGVMRDLLALVTRDLENLADEKSKLIDEQVANFANELSGDATLSRKMIHLYTSLPQVSSVLVGMRQPSYVQDALEGAKGSPLAATKVRETFAKFQPHKS